MDDARELLRRAEHYRRTADLVTDAQLSQALLDLAEKYETMAGKLLFRGRRAADGE